MANQLPSFMYTDVVFLTFAANEKTSVLRFEFASWAYYYWDQLIFSVDNTYADACFTSTWVGGARLTAYSCNCRAVAHCLCALTLRWVIHLMNPAFPKKLTWCQRLNYLAPASGLHRLIDIYISSKLICTISRWSIWRRGNKGMMSSSLV
jgi:hypothetical protein